jgi:glutaminyl-tRNA synthetase
MSKRKLLELVQSGTVRGWDDPRMPTLAGMRRRGFTPEAIRDFVDRIGVAKADSLVDFELLQFCVREDLNKKANRVMAVLHPLKVTIENYPEDQVEEFEAINNPEDESAGTRMVPFCKYLYIEQDDFSENPPKGWHRLSPGAEVRLKHAYYITCKEVIKDESGNVTELICTYDPSSRGGWTPDARKVKGTIHWVSARHSFDAEIRLYENLFTIPNINDIEEGKDYRDYLNPNSIKVLKNCKLEPSLKEVTIGEKFQFLRQGYFSVDYDSTADNLVFNLIVTLKDSWTKQLKKMGYV